MGCPTVLTVWSSRNEMFVSLVRDGGALPLVADPATVTVIPCIPTIGPTNFSVKCGEYYLLLLLLGISSYFLVTPVTSVMFGAPLAAGWWRVCDGLL